MGGHQILGHHVGDLWPWQGIFKRKVARPDQGYQPPLVIILQTCCSAQINGALSVWAAKQLQKLIGLGCIRRVCAESSVPVIHHHHQNLNPKQIKLEE